MTNFEKKMQEVATIVMKDKKVDLHTILCNAGNLPCSKCPIKAMCDKLVGKGLTDARIKQKMNEWLRQEEEQKDDHN